MDRPKVAQNFPYAVDMEPGTYYWCACGLSNKQPFCDGSHKGTAFTPVKETLDASKKVYWCGCKQSGKGAYCDGSHKAL